MKKWIAIILLILIVVIGYNYIYQDHRNISAEAPEFSINATAIKNEFAFNGVASEKKYLNTTVVIIGTVSDSNDKNVTLNSSVFCQFISPIKTPLDKDSKLKVKGRVIGYDDLLEQVKLDQCTIIN
jgi:hypothetical protein